jgi:hypothetical protein
VIGWNETGKGSVGFATLHPPYKLKKKGFLPTSGSPSFDVAQDKSFEYLRINYLPPRDDILKRRDNEEVTIILLDPRSGSGMTRGEKGREG